MTGRKLTARERLQYRFFCDQMSQIEWDLRHAVWNRRLVPSEWHSVLSEEPPPGKTRVTIRLDTDVVKFFRALGPEYQAKINRVLRAFVKARMARFVDGPESLDVLARGVEEDEFAADRPTLGAWERMLDDIAARAAAREGRAEKPPAPDR